MGCRRLVVLGLIVAACSTSPVGGSTTTTTAATTISTTFPTTSTSHPTTTLPAFSVDLPDAPAAIVDAVAAVYRYAYGFPVAPPDVPSDLVPDPRNLRPVELAGETAVASFRGSSVAVVRIGEDVWAAVEDGSGWRIVGGSAPSVGLDP